MLPDFETYFKALWGHEPFPWQRRLAGELLATGRWPSWITLPTGTGKTACIDIAIYHLATQVDRTAGARSAPVRVVFAVNRRIVVDEAYERAKEIGDKLRDALKAPGSDLHPVAEALFRIAQDEKSSPLEVYPLRGGTFTDHSWARTPTQPLVVTTTLDQLGSRLLFRGYGVSEYARPVHAALLANDALLILDEAHTSKAFSQTLTAVGAFRACAEEPVANPFHSVQLTATPPADAGEPFSLGRDDRDNPTIRARIGAAKPTGLLSVEGAKGKQRHQKMAANIAGEVGRLLGEQIRHTLVIVNRVATAEAVAAALSAAKEVAAEVRVMTGRMRPLDRDRLVSDLKLWLEPHEGVPPPEEPLILVATQCIEVGADYDFDALVTELAPLDCLRQRFGRLNRTGREIPAPGLIIAPEESLDAKKPDPIYNKCLPAVWEFLSGIANLDFGITAIDHHVPRKEALQPLLAPAEDAPVLLPAHIDLWCQTSPAPHAEPEPSLYIHGPQKGFPEVQLVVRGGLGDEVSAPVVIGALPPIGAEAVTLPLYVARDLLSGAAVIDDLGDAPHTEVARGSDTGGEVETAWIYRAGEAIPVRRARDLRAGDFVIVPSGSQAARAATADGSDQYELGFLTARDKVRIRFTRGALTDLGGKLDAAGAQGRFEELVGPLFQAGECGELDYSPGPWLAPLAEVASLLALHLVGGEPAKEVWETVAAIAARSREDGRPIQERFKVMPMPAGGGAGVIIESVGRAGFTKWPPEPHDLSVSSTVAEAPVSLADHHAGVSARAERNAGGLPAGIAQALRDAGRWHDLGKLDPRFQALLYGVACYAVEGREAIAKSGDGFRPRAVAEFLRCQSGLPAGFRHELLSSLIVAGSAGAEGHPERDLLLHLIASHHGRCRALAPVVPDPQPEPVSVPLGGEVLDFAGADCSLADLEAGVTRRFWSLTRRFGWWGLAYLETLLRLADQRESALPTEANRMMYE